MEGDPPHPVLYCCGRLFYQDPFYPGKKRKKREKESKRHCPSHYPTTWKRRGLWETLSTAKVIDTHVHNRKIPCQQSTWKATGHTRNPNTVLLYCKYTETNVYSRYIIWEARQAGKHRIHRQTDILYTNTLCVCVSVHVSVLGA